MATFNSIMISSVFVFIGLSVFALAMVLIGKGLADESPEVFDED